MLKYHRYPLAFATAMAMASTALGTTAVSAQTSVLKIAHAVPVGDPRDLGAQKIKEVLDADPSCEMDVQIFPAGQLGSVEDINEGVQFGAIEMSIMPAAYLTNTEPLFGVFDFPYFWPRDIEKLRSVHDSEAMQSLLDRLETHNYKAMDVWYNGHKHWTANKPLRELPDFQGLTARVMPSPVLAEQDKALGMVPTTIPFSEAYSALQSGAIDAQENPPAISFNMNFHEVQSHLMLSYHGTMDQMPLVNLNWWNQLNDACKAALTKAVQAGGEAILAATTEQDARALKAFADAGMEIVELSADELATHKESALTHVREFYITQHGDVGKQIVESLEQELAAQ